MSTSPVLRLPSSDPDQAWKDEAKHAHFINDLEANVAQLQSCQALLHNKEDATAFIEIFKKDIAILRLVSTEQNIAKEVPLWGKCDEIERKLNAIATQVSRIAAGLPATEERKALPAPAPTSSDQPTPPQKPATGGQSAPESPRGGLWGGFEQLVSQIGRYAPMLLGGIGAIAAAIGAFRQWGGQNQEAAPAGDDQQAPQSEPQQPSSVAAPVAQPSGEENPSAKEAPEASAEDTKPQERPPESAPPEPTDDAQRPGAAADPRGSQEKESISKEDSTAPRPEDGSSTAESQRQEEPAAPTVQPTREEEASSTKDTSQAPAETPRPQEPQPPRLESSDTESPAEKRIVEALLSQEALPKEHTPVIQARPDEETLQAIAESLQQTQPLPQQRPIIDTENLPQQPPESLDDAEDRLQAPLSPIRPPLSPLETPDHQPQDAEEVDKISLEGDASEGSSEEEGVEDESLEERSPEAAGSSEESDKEQDHGLLPTSDLTHNGLFEQTRRLSNDELREYAERNPDNAVLQRWAGLWEDYAAVDVPSLPDLATQMSNPKTTQAKIRQFFLNGTWDAQNFSEAARLRALTLLGTHYRIDRVHEPQLIHALETYNQYLNGLGSETNREAIRLLLARSMTSRNHLAPISSSLLRLVGIHVTVKPRR